MKKCVYASVLIMIMGLGQHGWSMKREREEDLEKSQIKKFKKEKAKFLQLPPEIHLNILKFVEGDTKVLCCNHELYDGIKSLKLEKNKFKIQSGLISQLDFEKKAETLTENDLTLILKNIMKYKRSNLLTVLVSDNVFDKLNGEYQTLVFNLLFDACQNKKNDDVNMLLKNKAYMRLFISLAKVLSVYKVLTYACKHGYNNVVTALIDIEKYKALFGNINGEISYNNMIFYISDNSAGYFAMVAAQKNHFDIVKTFLNNPDCLKQFTDNEFDEIIKFAKKAEQKEIVDILEKKLEKNSKENTKQSGCILQ